MSVSRVLFLFFQLINATLTEIICYRKFVDMVERALFLNDHMA